MKTCTKCKVEKPLSEFGRHAAAKDGLQSRCRPCANSTGDYYRANREKIRAQRKTRYQKDRIGILISKRMRKYGLTPERMLGMLEAQNGKCATCPESLFYNNDYAFHVDHDHSCCSGTKACGKCVRALLCQACNLALGHAREDATRLRALADYAEQWARP